MLETARSVEGPKSLVAQVASHDVLALVVTPTSKKYV